MKGEIGLFNIGVCALNTALLYKTSTNRSLLGCYYLPGIIAIAQNPKGWFMDGEKLKKMPGFFAMGQLINDYNDWTDLGHCTKSGSRDRAKLEGNVENSILRVNNTNPHLPLLAQSYIDQTRLLEEHVRTIKNPTIGNVIRYRELTNAIALTHIAATILPQEEIDFTQMIFTNSTYPQIENAYVWITQNGHRELSLAERKFRAIQSMIVGCQFIDDAADSECDTALGIPSLTTPFNEIKDERKVREIYKYYALNYFIEAQKLGFSQNVIKAVMFAFGSYKRLSNKRSGIMEEGRSRLAKN